MVVVMDIVPYRQVLLNLVEKISLLHNLSKSIAHNATSEEREFLKFYDAQIKGIRTRLKIPIDKALNKTDFTIPDYGPLYDGLSYFLGLHPQFRAFGTLPEVSKEIILVLEGLLPKKNYASIKPTIIYTPLYNYFQFSSLEYFHHLGILLEKGVPDCIVLMLPYADFQNPLMWVILSHELFHALEAQLGIVSKIAEKFPYHSDDVIRRSENWAREYCCDMIAIRIMGPAYLNSFLNILFSVHPWEFKFAESHPHPHSRIKYMLSYLEEYSLKSNSSTVYAEIYYELCKLFSIREERVQLAIEEDDLIQGLEQEVNNIGFLNAGRKEDLLIAYKLSNKLKNGIPLICSYRPEKPEFIKKREEVFLKTAEGQKASSIYNLLALAEEKPAKPFHILNAAWEHRVETFWNKFQEIFTSKLEYERKFLNIAEYVEDFSYSLIKSLETSKIHGVLMDEEEHASK